VKILQKVFLGRGATFLTHTVRVISRRTLFLYRSYSCSLFIISLISLVSCQ